MAEQLGDDHEVGPAAHERGRERVPEDMHGRVVVEARGRGDAGDDVVGAADAETLPALVEEQRGAVFGRSGSSSSRRLWDGCSSCSKPAVTASLLRFAQGESRDGEVRGGRQPPAVPMQSAPRPDCTTLLVLLKRRQSASDSCFW